MHMRSMPTTMAGMLCCIDGVYDLLDIFSYSIARFLWRDLLRGYFVMAGGSTVIAPAWVQT